jgi:hypothetical protein
MTPTLRSLYESKIMLFKCGHETAVSQRHCEGVITPATKYIEVVIPAKAGIQKGTGCLSKIPSLAGIKSGMTELTCLIAVLINRPKQSEAMHRPKSIEGSPKNREILHQAQDDLLPQVRLPRSLWSLAMTIWDFDTASKDEVFRNQTI